MCLKKYRKKTKKGVDGVPLLKYHVYEKEVTCNRSYTNRYLLLCNFIFVKILYT